MHSRMPNATTELAGIQWQLPSADKVKKAGIRKTLELG